MSVGIVFEYRSVGKYELNISICLEVHTILVILVLWDISNDILEPLLMH